MMHEEICTYEVCKLAKEKGFSIECDLFYNRNEELCDDGNYDSFDNEILCYAPTHSLLHRWLREEKIVVEVGYYSVERKYYWRVYDTSKCDVFASFIPPSKSMSRYDTWEQALESGLMYALKDLK